MVHTMLTPQTKIKRAGSQSAAEVKNHATAPSRRTCNVTNGRRGTISQVASQILRVCASVNTGESPSFYEDFTITSPCQSILHYHQQFNASPYHNGRVPFPKNGHEKEHCIPPEVIAILSYLTTKNQPLREYWLQNFVLLP